MQRQRSRLNPDRWEVLALCDADSGELVHHAIPVAAPAGAEHPERVAAERRIDRAVRVAGCGLVLVEFVEQHLGDGAAGRQVEGVDPGCEFERGIVRGQGRNHEGLQEQLK